MNTIAVVQARMGSTRLPGKVLMPIDDRPVLEWVLRRLNRVDRIDQIIVATTVSVVDAPIRRFCQTLEVPCIAGDEQDVLSRYAQAARDFPANRIVRITADCPLIDPIVVDQTIALMEDPQAVDYTCNLLPQRTFPRGLDVEVMSHDCLRRLDETTTDPRHREHVTLAVHEHPERYRTIGWVTDPGHADLRWTVDTIEDLELVRRIAACFGNDRFHWRSVIEAYASHPEWREINRDIIQKAA